MHKRIDVAALVLLFCLSMSNGLARTERAGRLPHGLDQAFDWIETELALTAEYNYVMTGKLRLLFFWVGRDDVGGGYIRLKTSPSNPDLETIQIKFGSDPEKAPRRINRWGAATEVVNNKAPLQSSAFFGFWKAAKGDSREAFEEEFSNEAEEKRFFYEAAINRVDPGSAASCVVPFHSQSDFNINQLDEAEDMVLENMIGGLDDSRVRYLDETGKSTCDRSTGFLFAVKSMVESVLGGQTAPFSSCYIHGAQRYTLILLSRKNVDRKEIKFELNGGSVVERSYENLIQAKFRVVNHSNGKKSSFELFLGTEGGWRGTPVQITHQPNWWFKVILNLDPTFPPVRRTAGS
jgi:hypothetical protein